MAEDSGSQLLTAWGKARPAPDANQSWHPLIYHCLDVAAAGEALLRVRPEMAVQRAARLGWTAEALRSLVVFLLALHDIGKLSRPFQAKVPELWPEGLLGPRQTAPPAGPRHDAAGTYLLREVLGAELTGGILRGWTGGEQAVLLAAFAGHHGRPVTRPDPLSPTEVFGGRCLAAAHAFLHAMHRLFPVEPVARPDRAALAAASWWLAGVAVLADWIGSAQRWFPYAAAPELAPAQYLDEVAQPRAALALAAAGIGSARASMTTGYRALTGEAHAPSPVQVWAETVSLPQGPFAAFIEDVTGGGKTEAALILAHRLMAVGRAQGLYLALPTMATANAMYDRLAGCYRRLFAAGERPSLALAHGGSRLHEGFRASLAGLGDAGRAREREDDERDASGAACAAWLADDRRKAFLADVGVGTIDQAFLAVLPARYQSLCLLGMAERAGAAVAWVRNTVDDALDAVAQLRAAGVAATLFHARFAMGDRLAIERTIVGRFGKGGDPAGRPGVLVATQVIEQSLDLDFDLLVSDLAPVDLLLQRAGRLWRHPGRPRPVAGPRLLVVSPEPSGDIGADWYAASFPRAAYVYRTHALLWLSAAELFRCGAVRVPEDVCDLVEAVYGGEDTGRYPPGLGRNWTEATGERQSARSMASANLLVVGKGYGGDHVGWDEDTRTPTRLGEETVTLRLARWDGGRPVPWCGDPDSDPHRAWALSEVAVRAARVRGVPEPVEPVASDKMVGVGSGLRWPSVTRPRV